MAKFFRGQWIIRIFMRMILKTGLTKAYVRTLYQGCARIDLELGVGPLFNQFEGPMQKLIDVRTSQLVRKIGSQDLSHKTSLIDVST